MLILASCIHSQDSGYCRVMARQNQDCQICNTGIISKTMEQQILCVSVAVRRIRIPCFFSS